MCSLCSLENALSASVLSTRSRETETPDCLARSVSCRYSSLVTRNLNREAETDGKRTDHKAGYAFAITQMQGGPLEVPEKSKRASMGRQKRYQRATLYCSLICFRSFKN